METHVRNPLYQLPSASSSPSAANLEYLSRAKERIKQGFGARRSWKLMFEIHSINFPLTLFNAISRFKTSVAYLRMNYAIIVILFLSLLWHLISLTVLVIMRALWLFLYFLRDEPLIVFNCTIDDRVVLVVLGFSTFVFLLLTNTAINILVSILVGAVVVSVNSSLRKIDDLYDEESTGLINGTSSSSS